jgi:COP9 signalosome complex subunit 4
VAEIHAAKKDFDRAAKILEKINLENAHRNVEVDEKAQIYVTIAEYWFQDDGDAVNAEKFISKAAHIMHLVKNQELQLRYKVCHARIMDSKRRFLVAAQSYYDLSN